jgi:pimeloyl-[acyl-carrier protein] synthase
MMVFSDPPVHSRVRNRMSEVFSPRNVQAMRPRVERIAKELLDDAVAKNMVSGADHASEQRGFDFIKDFASPLPLLVVCDILGFPRADRHDIKRWSDAFAMLLSFRTTIAEDLYVRKCLVEMRGYFERVVADFRSNPNDSLVSRLSDPAASPMDLDELFGNCVFLLAAGHETTTSVMANGLCALLRDRGVLQAVLADPSLIPNACEEMLRMESPVQWTSRRAKEGLELAGCKIEKNAMVLISIGAANRDPRQFPDPDRFDPAREDAAKHLAFSGGNHFCLGAGLARMELQVGIIAALTQLKNLRIAPGFKPSWRRGTTLHSIGSLPVLFESDVRNMGSKTSTTHR